MNEERNIKVSLEKAEEWYKGNDPSLRELALQAFTKEELEKKELPKTWEDYSYSTLAISSKYLSEQFKEYNIKLDVLTRLLILRDVYRQGWKPNWADGNLKHCIVKDAKTIKVVYYYAMARIFSFQTREIAEQFLENFKDDLEKLRDLL